MLLLLFVSCRIPTDKHKKGLEHTLVTENQKVASWDAISLLMQSAMRH